MPGKSSFPQILVSGYSKERISSFSRPGEWDFQYPNQEAEVVTLISSLSVLKYMHSKVSKRLTYSSLRLINSYYPALPSSNFLAREKEVTENYHG